MSDQNDMLKLLYDNNARLKQTETREVPGNIPGFTSFYASGTFTPAFQGSGTAGTWAYSVQAGFWSRIGNRVFFNLFVAASSRSVAPTGNARITGLPITSSATANTYSALAVDAVSGFTLPATCVMLTCRVSPSSVIIDVDTVDGTAPTAANALLATGLGTVGAIIISGFYMV